MEAPEDTVRFVFKLEYDSQDIFMIYILLVAVSRREEIFWGSPFLCYLDAYKNKRARIYHPTLNF